MKVGVSDRSKDDYLERDELEWKDQEGVIISNSSGIGLTSIHPMRCAHVPGGPAQTTVRDSGGVGGHYYLS